MNRTMNVLSTLAINALFITALVIVTGGIFTRASMDMDLYDYGQIVVLFAGLTALLGALYYATWLATYWLDKQVEAWLDGGSPMNSRFEDYWEDHRDRIDTIEQWSCGRRTLLHDLQFVQYLTRRWLFRTRYDLWSNVVSAYYRRNSNRDYERTVAGRF